MLKICLGRGKYGDASQMFVDVRFDIRPQNSSIIFLSYLSLLGGVLKRFENIHNVAEQ